jgi:transcription antitermination factor NusG
VNEGDGRVTGHAWYALKTRSRHERVVRDALELRGIECFLPVSRDRHRWSDRIRLVETPLFSTYLFVRLPVAPPRPSVGVKGVVELVSMGGVPAPVGDEEVDALRRLSFAGVALERHRFLRSGQRVRIRSGPFRGIEGTLVRRKGREKLVINVDLFAQAAALTLDGLDVEAA